MSEAMKIPEMLGTTSERDTMQPFSPMKRMRDDDKRDDVHPYGVQYGVPYGVRYGGPYGAPGSTLPQPIHSSLSGYPGLRMYGTQLQKLQQLKETEKNQEGRDAKRPRLQIPLAPESWDAGTLRHMQMTKNTKTLGSGKDDPAPIQNSKKETQKTTATTEIMGTETPATTAKKDREEVIGMLIREVWNDVRKSVAEVSKLKDDKIAYQQLRIERLEAEADKHRKKIKTLRAQSKDVDRLEREIELARSEIQYFKDQCKYQCECENCRDQYSEGESQTD